MNNDKEIDFSDYEDNHVGCTYKRIFNGKIFSVNFCPYCKVYHIKIANCNISLGEEDYQSFFRELDYFNRQR